MLSMNLLGVCSMGSKIIAQEFSDKSALNYKAINHNSLTLKKVNYPTFECILIKRLDDAVWEGIF
jgi:hypothetical protein